MAVLLVASPIQNTYTTVLCGSDKSVEHAYIIILVLPAMFTLAVAVLVRAIILDSAPICMIWSFCLSSARVLHGFVLDNLLPVSTRAWKVMCVLLRVCDKLAWAKLTDDEWQDEESFLGPDRRVCHDRAAVENLEEEEEEEEKSILRGQR